MRFLVFTVAEASSSGQPLSVLRPRVSDACPGSQASSTWRHRWIHSRNPHWAICGESRSYLRFKENEKTNLVLYCPDTPLFLFDWKQTLFLKLTPQMVFTDNRLCRFNLWLLCIGNGLENPTNSIDIIVYGTNFSPNLKWFKTYNWHVKSLWSVKKEGYLED